MQVVYFVAGLLAFLLGFGFFIAFVSRKLSGTIPAGLFGLVEKILFAGILLGVAGMFQPWQLGGYRIGFHVLLLATLGYIVWSHIRPRTVNPGEEGHP
jgi:hypothetical protein